MIRDSIKKIVAITLMMVMMLTSMSFAADDVGSNNYAHKAKYRSSWENSKYGELTYYFLESYFTRDAATYDSHLATASMALAMAGSSNSDRNIKAALTELGCTDYVSQDYGSSSENSIGVATAKKVLASGKTLLPVVIRGAGYENEWMQNFKAGTSGNAEGYEAPANKVVRFVKEQVGSKKNVVVWIMGYSRGGAIANLAAKTLSDTYGKTGVYAYCFDSPMAASPADKSYKNIHLIQNAYDGITLVLPEYMGFGSNGTLEKKLGLGDESAMLTKLESFSDDFSKFASPSKLKWAKFTLNVDLGENLLSQLGVIVSGLYTNEIGSAATPTEMWNELLERIKVAFPTRAAYADKQDGFVAAVRFVRSLTAAQKDTLKKSISDIGTLLTLIGNEPLIAALASVQDGEAPNLNDNEYEDIANTIYGALFSKSGFDTTQKADAELALKTLIKPVFIILAADYKADKQVLGTIIQSDALNIVKQCHYLEVNMAWLMTEDSYYNGEIAKEDESDFITAISLVTTTKISKLTAAKKAFTVKWSKKSSNLNGYQIQYSTNPKFKSDNKTLKITKKTTTSKKIKGLKAKKKYYVRIRCYKNVNGKPVYGKWSAKKSITTKK